MKITRANGFGRITVAAMNILAQGRPGSASEVKTYHVWADHDRRFVVVVGTYDDCLKAMERFMTERKVPAEEVTAQQSNSLEKGYNYDGSIRDEDQLSVQQPPDSQDAKMTSVLPETASGGWGNPPGRIAE